MRSRKKRAIVISRLAIYTQRQHLIDKMLRDECNYRGLSPYLGFTTDYGVY